jgi:molybdate transport system regulatory protein
MNITYRVKLWVVNENSQPVFGDGLARLLEEIEKRHSVLDAAKSLQMSYRYALHRITLAEERLGESLVTRVRGGAKGGGSSHVTAFGKKILSKYRDTQKKLNDTIELLE